MENLINGIRNWLILNLVKCNDDKTEFLVFCSQFQSPVQIERLNIGEQDVQASSQVRNLGLIMDPHLTMENHIKTVTSAGFFLLRDLSRIKMFLTEDALKTAVHAFITSKVDYCNAVLYGLPLRVIDRLQYLQNSAARMISSTKKFDHITPVLKNFHWLPVLYRIQYKILLLTYKALNGLAPTYISDMLHLTRRGDSLVVP